MADRKDREEIGKLEEGNCKEIEWIIPDFLKIKKNLKGKVIWKSRTFSFNDDVWWLSLDVFEYKDFLFLGLERELKIKCKVKFSICLKNPNDSEMILKNELLSDEENYCHLIQSDSWDPKSQFGDSDALTIICTLRKEIAQADLLDKTTPIKLKNLDKLSDNLKNLFGNQETCDTTFKVKDKDFGAHRSVLIARSSVFAATFKHDSLESQTGVINIPDCDPDSFQAFLEYLYCGKLEEISLGSALNLYYTSDKYDVQELKAFCVEYLLQCLTIENVCEIAVFADKYDEMKLFSSVQEFFIKNAFKVLLTTEWDNLQTNDHRLANKLLKEMAKVKELSGE